MAEKDGLRQPVSISLGGSIGAVAPAPLYAHHGWLGCAVLIGLVALASTALARVAWQETVVNA